jgi:hypothetical protein
MEVAAGMEALGMLVESSDDPDATSCAYVVCAWHQSRPVLALPVPRRGTGHRGTASGCGDCGQPFAAPD